MVKAVQPKEGALMLTGSSGSASFTMASTML